jgi:trehalose-6-phosphate synthase
MMEWSDTGKDFYLTYNPKSFEDINFLFSLMEKLYSIKETALRDAYKILPESLKEFISGEEWMKMISGFQNQSNSINVFTDKFFNWMNGLKTLQFIHFARDRFYPNVSLENAWVWLSNQINGLHSDVKSIKDALDHLREYDRKHPHHYIKKNQNNVSPI